MPERIQAARALRMIDDIIDALMGCFDRLPEPVQPMISRLYATMRAEYTATLHEYQQGAVIVRFLEALDAIPEVRACVGPLLDATKGRPMRSLDTLGDTTLLERLPETLGGDAPRFGAQGSDPPDVKGSPWDDLKVPVPSAAPQVIPPKPPSAPPKPPSVSPRMPAPSAPPQPLPRMPAPSAPPKPPSAPPKPPLDLTTEGAVAPTLGAALRPALLRYPDLEYPTTVLINTRTSLIVSLLLEAPEPDAVPLKVEDSLDRPLEVEVVVRARGFQIVGSNTQVLTVARDADSELRFVLIPQEVGVQTIRVDFYQNNRCIGTARRQTVIAAQPHANPVVVAQPEVEPIMLAAAEAIAPDIELCVETDPHDEQMLYFTLHSSCEAVDYHHARMGAVRLQGTPLQKMQTVYDELSKLAGQTPTHPDTIDAQQRRLANLGRLLWDELFPPELKAAYWKIRDKVKAVLVTSDEPWIPWEIVKPYRFDEYNQRLDEPHLCEQFNVARWLSGPGMSDRMPVQRIRPVAPLNANLPSVGAELQYLKRLSQLHPELLPDPPYSECSRVIELFENGAFNVLHVAAHGGFDAQMPHNSGISLTDGVLRPSDLIARFGGSRPRPLIFINACHGARAEYGFTGLGGWADRLVRSARVGAFIGAAWEVNDRLALAFAEAFYTALLRDGKSIGESFRLAREQIRDAAPANSTWLAYVLYADPEARVLI